jgi:hypothetical protein
VAEHVTGISLRDVRKLLDDKSPGEKIFDAIDSLIGVALALSPVGLGPGGVALWALLEPKNELVGTLKQAVKFFTKAKPSDYVEQASNLAAANCLLTYTAFFDALVQRLPDLTKEIRLTDAERSSIAARVAGAPTGSDPARWLISIPRPDIARSASDARQPLYLSLSTHLLDRVRVAEIWRQRPEAWHERVTNVLRNELSTHAEAVYQAEFLGLAAEFPAFFIWSLREDQAARDALITSVGADIRTQFDLVGRAIQDLDLGMQRLADAIRRLPPATAVPRSDYLAEVALELQRRYAADIEQPVIDDQYEPDNGGPRLSYPRRDEAYIPQPCRMTRYSGETTSLEHEDYWTAMPVREDLGPCLMEQLESPYSVRTPLLILGDPGSGKSLLTRVLAARLAYPAYAAVRVELRDVNPDGDIQSQIEAAIRRDTGRDVNWADFAANLALTPPVVILDGYDELLQATGNLFADYLDKVRQFQQRELLQRRPVRVVVTSRITLIDKAIVPDGTAVIRLEAFDERRRQTWTGLWNACNASYFHRTGVRPFQLPGNENLRELAAQPLLLQMLAIYDSAGNELNSNPDLDQTLLYDALLRRFIDRELAKGKAGAEFRALPAGDRKTAVDREFKRLGVAAIGMFNRQALHIRRDALDADLAFFTAERLAGQGGLRRLSQAELLLGSFFFVHESRSRLREGAASDVPADSESDAAPAGSTAYEFLHKTFGEFLTADFLLRQVLDEGRAIGVLGTDISTLAADTALANMLRQQLTMVSQAWFGCLMHTPLHTSPVILRMIEQWGAHRMKAEPRPRTDVLRALDMLVLAQLRTVLTDVSLPDLAAKAKESPYTPLPTLGHLAIYTLNLVVLRTYLAEGRTWILDEAELGGEQGGLRPWDRLAALWRSWFPADSLSSLAANFTPQRQGTRLTLQAFDALFTIRLQDSRMDVAYNAAVALADDLTAAAIGLNVAALRPRPWPAALGRQVKDQAAEGAPELLPLIDAALVRTSGDASDVLDLIEPDDQGRGGVLPGAGTGYGLNVEDLADRLLLAPRHRALVCVSSPDLNDVMNLSRYEAEVVMHSRASLATYWVRDLMPPRFQRNSVQWGDFLMRPAAAPALRAACRACADERAALAVGRLADMSADAPIVTFDVDTAAALAVLAWRGQETDLAARALDAIIAGCQRDGWDLRDIPVESWDGLADLLVTADGPVAARKRAFIELLDAAVGSTMRDETSGMPAIRRPWAYAEFWVNALRIGVPDPQGTLLGEAVGLLNHSWAEGRLSVPWRALVVMVRWARETDDPAFARQLFQSPQFSQSELEAALGQPLGNIDVDRLATSLDLSYRAAMDLRWVVDALRGTSPTPRPSARKPASGQSNHEASTRKKPG